VRLSRAFVPTLKEVPAEATAPSHVLMLRGAIVRQLMAGVYSYLPFGWRIFRKIMDIIREEMDAIGGQEWQLPALNPRAVWEETGRADDFGPVQFRLRDRKDQELVLAPTHEEIICYHARNAIRSYRDMPQIWYQIQTKYRDEERPRGGVLRGRQFIMKDAYTLDASQEGLDYGYSLHRQAYQNIYSRCGLEYFIVGASSGLMGGSGSEEFMVPSVSGEDRVAWCRESGYAANVEVATSKVEPVIYDEEPLEKIPTPGQRTIEDLVEFLSIPVERTAKSRVYIDSDGKPVLVLVRGDYEVNDEKVMKHLGAAFRPAHPEEVREHTGADPGSVGPVGFTGRILADELLEGTHGMVSGANEDDYHFKGISLARDAKVDAYVDLRVVREGDPCPRSGKPLEVLDCIEVGHIFKLGTKYADAMGATFLDENGQEKPIIMGSYGIGIERIAASAIEQNFDDNGMIWPLSIAPFQVHLMTANANVDEVTETAESLYKAFLDTGIEVLYDDREASAGYKFKDADLIGVPFRVVVGKKGLERGMVEVSTRAGGRDSRQDVAPDDVVGVVADMIATETMRLNSQAVYPLKREEL
jgi:prolyl-tRNA synthetase